MDAKPQNEVDLLDGTPTAVPGQTVLPGMQQEVGYESCALEPWQEVFCWGYVTNGGVAYQAYLSAKPKVKEATARVESSKLLTLPNIIARIDAIKQENSRRWQVSADELMQYHAKVLKIDRRLFFDENGRRLALKDLDDDLASIVDLDTSVTKEYGIQLVPVIPARHKSADSLSRMMGLDKAKLELTGKDGGPVESVTASAADELAKLAELRERFNRHGAS